MLKKTLTITIIVLAFISTSSADQGSTVYLSMNKKQSSGASGDLASPENVGGELVPTLNQDGKKFRIAIIRSGEYWQYAANLNTLLNALIDSGWVNKIQLSEEALKTVPGMLAELRNQDYSDYIEFPPELYFDFEFKEEKATDPKQAGKPTSTAPVDLNEISVTRATLDKIYEIIDQEEKYRAQFQKESTAEPRQVIQVPKK